MPGTWERLALGEEDLRGVNPGVVYARAKGFGMHGPLVSRPSFDYVVQAATGMEMTQGGGHAQPTNFTANDYCTGIHLAAGVVARAARPRARASRCRSVEASLMMSATVFQSEHVAEIAARGHRDDAVGPGRLGPAAGCRLYAGDRRLAHGLRGDAAAARRPLPRSQLEETSTTPLLDAIERAIGAMTVDEARARLDARRRARRDQRASERRPRRRPGPGAGAAHDSAPSGRRQRSCRSAIPLQLSVDAPAVKGPAPAPARWQRRPEEAPMKLDTGLGADLATTAAAPRRPRRRASTASWPRRR